MNKDVIQIVDYSPLHKIYFKELNYQWIKRHFTVEKEDIKLLEEPEKYIIEPGGAILIAENGGDIIGTCGLTKINETTFEIVKMAVDEKARGRNIGYLLGKAIINKAKNLGASKIQLETSSKLIPALSLYRKLGFTEIPFVKSGYKRCDVKMELKIK